MEIIFTKHALARLRKRGISEDYVNQTLNAPDRVIDLPKDGLKKYVKLVKRRNVQVVAKPSSDRKKIVVVSVWVRGEDDQRPLWIRILGLPFRIIWALLIQAFTKRNRKKRK